MNNNFTTITLPEETLCAGILNFTPDSFSDGGLYFSSEKALQHAQKLMTEGADLVEVGADSTRPGSECIGVNEEINRLKIILPSLKEREIRFGVDTHHAEVAQYAIEQGALYINDISGGMDEGLISCVSRHPRVELILMHSRLSAPHVFGESPTGDIVTLIVTSLQRILGKALSCGMAQEKIILDTGMGRFISAFPFHSHELLSHYKDVIKNFSQMFMLGISRKGFLGKDLTLDEKDALSSSLSLDPLLTRRIKYIRVHDCSRYVKKAKVNA